MPNPSETTGIELDTIYTSTSDYYHECIFCLSKTCRGDCPESEYIEETPDDYDDIPSTYEMWHDSTEMDY